MRAKKLQILITALALVPFGLAAAEEQAAADAGAAPVAASQAPVPSEEGSSPAPAASSSSQATLDIPVAKPSGEEADAGTADSPPMFMPSWMVGMDQPSPGAPMAGARCGGGGRHTGAGYQGSAPSDSDMPSPPPGYSARAVMPRGWQRGPAARFQGPWGYGRGMADYGEAPADDWPRSDVQARAYPDMPGWGTGYPGMPKGMGGPMGQRPIQPTAGGQGTDEARMLEVLTRIEARLGRIEALLGKLTW